MPSFTPSGDKQTDKQKTSTFLAALAAGKIRAPPNFVKIAQGHAPAERLYSEFW